MMTASVGTYQNEGSGLRRVLRAIGKVLVDTSTVARCAREAERLSALSDAELAGMGLTRDRVVQHAFRRYIHMGI